MKLLLTGAFKYTEEHLNKLKSLGYEIIFIQDERVPLEVNVSDIDAVVCNSLFTYNDIKKFKNLKFIQLTSAGMDRVPLDFIKDQRIKLFNAKGVYSVPMAEWVVLKILEIYKKSKKFYEAQREHKWEKQRDLFELTNKTAAIIGFGDVGAEVAKRLKAFEVNVVGVSRSKKESKYLDKFYFINAIDEVLKISDIVILTLPLTADTHNFIDNKKIEKIKEHCVLINVSRGEIINESALLMALDTDKFQGVALDVFVDEPLSNSSLFWKHEKVIITPHNSFVSDKIPERLFNIIIKNLTQIYYTNKEY